MEFRCKTIFYWRQEFKEFSLFWNRQRLILSLLSKNDYRGFFRLINMFTLFSHFVDS